MKTLTVEEQTKYREMLGARKRLQATDRDAMELVMDLVVDFGLWLERRKPKQKAKPTGRTFTTPQLESGFANYPEREITPAQQATFYAPLNTYKQRNAPEKPGPEAARKTNFKGERRTWTPDGKKKKPTRVDPIDREPKRRPEIVRPLKPIKPPSLPERIRAVLLECGPLTNADLSEKFGWGATSEGVQRCQVATRQMQRRGEIEVVGTKPKFGSIPANLYMAVPEKPVKRGAKGSNLLRVAEWLNVEGPKTIDQMAEFLGTDAKFIRSIAQRLIRYGMAHQRGRVVNEETNRPLNLYVAGPEPRKGA